MKSLVMQMEAWVLAPIKRIIRLVLLFVVVCGCYHEGRAQYINVSLTDTSVVGADWNMGGGLVSLPVLPANDVIISNSITVPFWEVTNAYPYIMCPNIYVYMNDSLPVLPANDVIISNSITPLSCVSNVYANTYPYDPPYGPSYDVTDGTMRQMGAVHNYEIAATDWISPYYLNRSSQGMVGYLIDAEGGYWSWVANALGATPVGDPAACDPSLTSIDLTRYEQFDEVNYESASSSTYILYHSGAGSDWWSLCEPNLAARVAGQNPSASIYDEGTLLVTASNNATGPTTQLVSVPPLTVAFVSNPDFALGNIYPWLGALPGCPAGGAFVDVYYDPARVGVDETINKSSDGSSGGDFPPGSESVSDFPPVNSRYINWYGPFSQALQNSSGYWPYHGEIDAVTITRTPLYNGGPSQETILRESIADFLSRYNYNTNNAGKQVGELVTFEVVPAHPACDFQYWANHGNIPQCPVRNYAFQVAMQLGKVLKVQPLYAYPCW